LIAAISANLMAVLFCAQTQTTCNFALLHTSHGWPSNFRARNHDNFNEEMRMKLTIVKLMCATTLFGAMAFAQSDAMKPDTMKNDQMQNDKSKTNDGKTGDAMKSDSMKKDDMAKDSTKKSKKSKKAAKKSDDTMKH
jgi:pentapeptide MXKDX repeat protein